jgi:hypothetical protein
LTLIHVMDTVHSVSVTVGQMASSPPPSLIKISLQGLVTKLYTHFKENISGLHLKGGCHVTGRMA